MANDTPTLGGPHIIGEKRIKYAIGDPTEEHMEFALAFSATPLEAGGAFVEFLQRESARGNGPPIPFVLTWVYTAKAMEYAAREREGLLKRIEALEKDVASL